MSRGRSATRKQFFADLRRAREKIAEPYDNESWRREALIRPVLRSPFGLGFQEHEILCEVSFPIRTREDRLLADQIYPHRKRIRADYLIQPEGNVRPSGLVEAKRILPDFVSMQKHKNQALIGQVLANADWGLLTDGEAWLLMRGDEDILYCESLESLESGIQEFQFFVGREALIQQFGSAPRIRLMPVMYRSRIASQPSPHRSDSQPNWATMKEIGPASSEYNSISWAAGDTERWWWPDKFKQLYWPPEAKRQASVGCCVEAFMQLGYEPSQHGALEPGFSKVSIFGDADLVHAARQVSNGLWTSKLGRSVLVQHGLSAIDELYGRPAVFMRRSLTRGTAQQLPGHGAVG